MGIVTKARQYSEHSFDLGKVLVQKRKKIRYRYAQSGKHLLGWFQRG